MIKGWINPQTNGVVGRGEGGGEGMGHKTGKGMGYRASELELIQVNLVEYILLMLH